MAIGHASLSLEVRRKKELFFFLCVCERTQSSRKGLVASSLVVNGAHGRVLLVPLTMSCLRDLPSDPPPSQSPG